MMISGQDEGESGKPGLRIIFSPLTLSSGENPTQAVLILLRGLKNIFSI
jgi:hypothetical protein